MGSLVCGLHAYDGSVLFWLLKCEVMRCMACSTALDQHAELASLHPSATRTFPPCSHASLSFICDCRSLWSCVNRPLIKRQTGMFTYTLCFVCAHRSFIKRQIGLFTYTGPSTSQPPILCTYLNKAQVLHRAAAWHVHLHRPVSANDSPTSTILFNSQVLHRAADRHVHLHRPVSAAVPAPHQQAPRVPYNGWPNLHGWP